MTDPKNTRGRPLLMTPTPSMAICSSLDDLARLLHALGPLYVRYSRGPDVDASEQSKDGESGLPLPGLSVNPLSPERWWTRPLQHWLARQLMQYRHLEDRDSGEFAWILAGDEVARGPDCEPLLAGVVPIADVTEHLLNEADQVYAAVFDRGALPADGEGEAED